MNIRNVLRTYSLLRQLADDEAALLNTLRSLNDGERELLVESLSPSGKKSTKKSSKRSSLENYVSCERCGAPENDIHHRDKTIGGHEFIPSAGKPTKSRRATELSDTLRQRAAKKAITPDDDPNEHCQKEFPGGFVCDEPADANVHHLRGATGYHPFVSGAPPAVEKSSRNGEDGSSTANSEAEKESVSTATGG